MKSWSTLAEDLGALAAESCEPFHDIGSGGLGPMLDRIGDCEVVLIGEATHGTSEFYRYRARITRALIEQKDFRLVTAEADWPDAARIDRYVRGRRIEDGDDWPAFARFPTWMWRNLEVREFIDWLQQRNQELPHDRRAGFFGLDVYSLHRSIGEVLGYLDRVDPGTAEVARRRYGCFDPWEQDAAEYGYAAVSGTYKGCEDEVVANLRELLERRLDLIRRGDDGEAFFDALQNARVVQNAERYYRVMYLGSVESWNLRDSHMFETLQALRRNHGGAKAVVWAHNSHVGNARHTHMGRAGEHNIGSLSRDACGDAAYLVGFGTDHGTVAAASDWGGRREIKDVVPARDDSYEGAFHRSRLAAFLLPIRHGCRELRDSLAEERLQRAIGVIYRPETERRSHYFEADLSRQFDEYIWIDETSAVTELEGPHLEGVPETYPFGV